MLQISVDNTLPASRDLVFAAYRDRLVELAPSLPNIREIKVRRRVDRQGEVELAHEWVGEANIPDAARAVLKDPTFRWADRSIWRSASYTVDWSIDALTLSDAFMCTGQHKFTEQGQATRLATTGRLICDTSKVKGVHKVCVPIADRVAERLIAQLIKVNFDRVCLLVRGLLASDRQAHSRPPGG